MVTVTMATCVPAGVTLEVLLTFNRLKTLSTDPSVIAMAIRKSTSGLLEVCVCVEVM